MVHFTRKQKGRTKTHTHTIAVGLYTAARSPLTLSSVVVAALKTTIVLPAKNSARPPQPFLLPPYKSSLLTRSAPPFQTHHSHPVIIVRCGIPLSLYHPSCSQLPKSYVVPIAVAAAPLPRPPGPCDRPLQSRHESAINKTQLRKEKKQSNTKPNRLHAKSRNPRPRLNIEPSQTNAPRLAKDDI